MIDEFKIDERLISLSEEKVDEMILNHSTFLLYIGWNKCPDCLAFQDTILNDFNGTLYYLESDSYRINKPKSKDDIQTKEDLDNYNRWLSFANKYQFISYREGRIPAILFFKSGVMEEYITYKNEVIEDEIIVESFYKELIHQKLTDEELSKIHKEKVLSFLNQHKGE